MLGAKSRNLDIALLLEAIYGSRGYDFRQYSRVSIIRRINSFMAKYSIRSPADITRLVRRDTAFFNLLVSEISVTVTEMFRHPATFRLLRERVLPELTDKPRLKIWSAGCATGEETYSLAILLHEAGLLQRSQIYATDINPVTLQTAAKGMLPLHKLKHYTGNYYRSGGQREFCSYYTVRHNIATMERFLTKQIQFTVHNLVNDRAFGDMDIIFCHNVLIYFTPDLQQRVIALFLDSLKDNGFLSLGEKEHLSVNGHEQKFDSIAANEKLYRKKTLQGAKDYAVW